MLKHMLNNLETANFNKTKNYPPLVVINLLTLKPRHIIRDVPVIGSAYRISVYRPIFDVSVIGFVKLSQQILLKMLKLLFW